MPVHKATFHSRFAEMPSKDVLTPKDKTKSETRLASQSASPYPKSESIPAATKHVFMWLRLRRLILRGLDGIEKLLFRRYVEAIHSMTSPSEDLLRLNAALRKHEGRGKLKADGDDCE